MANWWQHADPPKDPRYYPAPVPSAGVFDSPLVAIVINQEWVAHLDGLLSRLQYEDAWLGTDDEIAFAIAETNRLLAGLVTMLTDEKLKITAADTTPGYLIDKLLAGAHISLTKNNAGADETLTAAVTGLQSSDIGDFTEAAQDAIALLLAAGTNITLSYNDAANQLTISGAAIPPQVYPTNAYWTHAADIVTSGAAIIPTVDAAEIMNGYWRQNPSVVDDEFVHDVLLAAGSYVLHILGQTANVMGIQGLYLDGTSFAFVDWYSATTTYNVHKTASFIVATGGTHQIKTHVSSKNASSTNFRLSLTYFWIEKV